MVPQLRGLVAAREHDDIVRRMELAAPLLRAVAECEVGEARRLSGLAVDREGQKIARQKANASELARDFNTPHGSSHPFGFASTETTMAETETRDFSHSIQPAGTSAAWPMSAWT